VDEVSRRGRLVKDVTSEIENMHKELARKVNVGGNKLPDPSAFDADAEDGDEYAAFEQQRQQEIMAEQDEALDGVFRTVGNLRAQADTMGRELEEQGELLEDVHGITDRVGGKLKGGMKSLNEIIRRNEGELNFVSQNLKLMNFRKSIKLVHRDINFRAYSSACSCYSVMNLIERLQKAFLLVPHMDLRQHQDGQDDLYFSKAGQPKRD
jgi:hypothetical protein